MRHVFLWLMVLTAGAPILPPHDSLGATEEIDRTFARILRLEDQRSTGGGALRGYLDPSIPAAVRVRAALAIGRIGAPVVTPYDLIGALRDPEPEVRRMAAFALGEMDDIKAAPLLASASMDPDAGVRAMAAEGLGKLKDAASVPSLMMLLEDRDADVVGTTLLALWKIDAGDALAHQVAKASSIYAAASGALRWRAAYFLMRALMGHPDEETIETALLAAAGDEDPLVRSFAARGLGASRSAQSTQKLLDLTDDGDWRVRVNAFNGLKTRRVEAEGLGAKRWRNYKHALSDKNAGVVLSALAALETCSAADAGVRLRKALSDSRPRFREVAVVALAQRDRTSALTHIRPLASDPVWSVRARASEALAAIGTEDVLADLARLAGDADPRVRSVAIESAAKLKLEEVETLIAAALKDPDPFVRAAALEATMPAEPRSTRGADSLVPALVEGYRRGLTDSPDDARLSALGALARTGTDVARSEIEKALDDPDYLVRRRAAELLRDTFHLDRFAKVGGPQVTRTEDDYLEVVARGRRRVTAILDTDAGRIEVELFSADAPLTVDNFIRLAGEGRYDGLAFHRVVPNFVIQDGDPRGDGNGGPPWQIRCEINLRRFGTGAMGMALSGKDTGGSQYFITHSPQPHLDGGYTIFGQVISGQEVVDRLMQGDVVRHVTISEGPAPS